MLGAQNRIAIAWLLATSLSLGGMLPAKCCRGDETGKACPARFERTSGECCSFASRDHSRSARSSSAVCAALAKGVCNCGIPNFAQGAILPAERDSLDDLVNAFVISWRGGDVAPSFPARWVAIDIQHVHFPPPDFVVLHHALLI